MTAKNGVLIWSRGALFECLSSTSSVTEFVIVSDMNLVTR